MRRRKDPLRRRHHTVSKFYLAGFADDSSRITQVHLPGHHSHMSSVANATVDTDFYSLRTEDGSMDDSLERAFGELESKAASAIQLVGSGIWPLPTTDRAALASWVALQYVRSPAVRNVQTQVHAQMHQMIVLMAGKDGLREAIENHEGRPITESRLEWEWHDLTTGNGPTLEPDPSFHALTIAETLPWLAEVVFRSQWMLVSFERRKLVTCDHPVSLVPPADLHPFIGVGLATASAYLMPLNRKLGLIVRPQDYGTDMEISGTTSLWKSFTETVLQNARKYVFHHPEDSIPSDMMMPEPRNLELSSLDTSLFEAKVQAMDATYAEDEQAARRRMQEFMKEGPTVSGADLIWPIPGRIPPGRSSQL